ncbi:MAG: hypothetical protein C0433_08900 [Cyclobacterium sp.]|nr:hypothetical protein [Cyclobacterium sp.]
MSLIIIPLPKPVRDQLCVKSSSWAFHLGIEKVSEKDEMLHKKVETSDLKVSRFNKKVETFRA